MDTLKTKKDLQVEWFQRNKGKADLKMLYSYLEELSKQLKTGGEK